MSISLVSKSSTDVQSQLMLKRRGIVDRALSIQLSVVFLLFCSFKTEFNTKEKEIQEDRKSFSAYSLINHAGLQYVLAC